MVDRSGGSGATLGHISAFAASREELDLDRHELAASRHRHSGGRLGNMACQTGKHFGRKHLDLLESRVPDLFRRRGLVHNLRVTQRGRGNLA